MIDRSADLAANIGEIEVAGLMPFLNFTPTRSLLATTQFRKIESTERRERTIKVNPAAGTASGMSPRTNCRR